MNDLRSGGLIANKNGSELEQFIEMKLLNKGYTYIPRKEFTAARYLEQPIYSFQFYVGQSIYDTPVYCDYILYHPEKWPDCLVIEAKWQQSKGSVDEKYPFAVLNIKTRSPYKTIMLLDGKGYKKGAEKWLRAQVDKKLLGIFNMVEFQTWVNKQHI